jgi:hypothetical protein
MRSPATGLGSVKPSHAHPVLEIMHNFLPSKHGKGNYVHSYTKIGS